MVPIVELIRLEESTLIGTLGILKINKEVFCFTLEPSDFENHKSVSSIPAQQYICARYSSPKYPNTFQVINVPDRTSILFHAGNTIDNTEGCILLGSEVGKLREKRAILNSGKTFNSFMEIMQPYQSFHLTITEVY